MGSPEDLYLPSADRAIRELLLQVVKHEGPIRLELAVRRIVQHWDVQRVTRRTVERIRGLLAGLAVRVVPDADATFLWPSDVAPNTYTLFRVPADDPDSFRDAAELPLEEIQNAVLHILRQVVSAPEQDLIREVGRVLGFRRIGRQVEERMHSAIEQMIQAATVTCETATIALPNH